MTGIYAVTLAMTFVMTCLLSHSSALPWGGDRYFGQVGETALLGSTEDAEDRRMKLSELAAIRNMLLQKQDVNDYNKLLHYLSSEEQGNVIGSDIKEIKTGADIKRQSKKAKPCYWSLVSCYKKRSIRDVTRALTQGQGQTRQINKDVLKTSLAKM